MRTRRCGIAVRLVVALLGILAVAASIARAGETIRIRVPKAETGVTGDGPPPAIRSEGRRGFDYDAFTTRLETLWFQRKAFLADGRDADAANQAQLIRAFCSEEGVRRLDGMAAAALAEAHRHIDEGNFTRARATLELAEFFRPDGSQVRRARAEVAWKSGAGVGAAASEWLAAIRAAAAERWRDLTLLHHLLLLLLVAWVGASTVFATLLLIRYHAPLRHEIEERIEETAWAQWAEPAGWAVVLLPLLLWVGTGWAALYLLVLTFRFMRRGERVAAICVLAITAALPPLYRAAVALRGMAEDPVVRHALASSGGAYDPERVVELQRLVESHPDDSTYRFLLAGLYKNGRYFEEAFEQYQRILEQSTGADPAYVNLGNIFLQLGQPGEALVNYRRAIELRPRSALAYYDAYVAQSETFRFKEAQEYLDRGSAADPEGMTELLYRSGRETGRPMVVDAVVDLRALWRAALEGRPLQGLSAVDERSAWWTPHLRSLVNPLSALSLLAIGACCLLVWSSRRIPPARACIRCGRAFCALCRNEREKGKEYCTQCLHLFVLGDGLAAETKTRKLYEVERHGRRWRLARRLTSLLVPGASHLLGGRAFAGLLLSLAWIASLLAWEPAVVRPLVGLSGINLDLDLLRTGVIPARYALDAVSVAGLVTATVVWIVANARRFRVQEI